MSSLEPLCNFRRNPCSLEHAASVVFAAGLCRQAAMMNSTNPTEKVREIIALPPAIEQKIERFMPIVKEQIAWWNNFYNREIFFDTPGTSRAQEYFHLLVWSDDGTINDEETAREMLKQDDLDAEEKYRIACNHCLKTEIRTLRSNLKTENNLQKRDYVLVYCWECVWRTGITNGLIRNTTKRLLIGEHVYPDCAVYYFLNRLILRKQIDYLPLRYRQMRSFRSWEKFLMELSDEQLVKLFNHSIGWRFVDKEQNLLHYLMRFWMHADFVVQVWMRIRDAYSKSRFAGMIEKLLRSTDYISLAEEIFNLAPYELQLAVQDDYLKKQWWWRNRNSNLTDVRLDVAILSIFHPDYSLYEYWAATWWPLFRKYPTDCFMQLLHVYCREEGSEESFKTNVLELRDYSSKEYCRLLFADMRFSELDQFLNVFSSDTCRIMKTKQIILRKNLIERADWFEYDDAIIPPPSQLVDFIEGSFGNIRSANEFKIAVLSSVKCLNACYKAAGNDMFDWLKDAVWMCSCNDDDFRLYKSMFLQLDVELAKSSDIPDVFKDSGWMSFLKWCSNES